MNIPGYSVVFKSVSKLPIMHKFYACVFEVLFGFFAAKGLKLNFPLFDEASPSCVEVVGVSRMRH